MTLVQEVEQTIKRRRAMLRIEIDRHGVTISEWPSCMVRSTGPTLTEALRAYLPPKSKAGQQP